MSALVWDQTGERFYETGVNRGVLYPRKKNGKYEKGVAWNGLTAVNESPSGAEANPIYADNIKYLNLISTEEFGATVEAYTYPDEFAECDGSKAPKPGVKIGQQARKAFGLCYTTKKGNDVDNTDYGEKIHIIYNALAAPSAKDYATINDSPEAITFSWELSTTPVEVKGYKPTASLVIDSDEIDQGTLELIKSKLYGTEDTEPTLLTPEEIIELAGIAAVTEPISSTETKYSKQISDLQEDVTIDGNLISGTLKYVTGFTGFSSNTAEQSGNYLALTFASENGEKIETRIVTPGTDKKFVDATSDKFCIYRVADAEKQTIEVKTTKGSDTVLNVYDLSGLELAPNNAKK